MCIPCGFLSGMLYIRYFTDSFNGASVKLFTSLHFSRIPEKITTEKKNTKNKLQKENTIFVLRLIGRLAGNTLHKISMKNRKIATHGR